jgi:hypothetical protein
MNMDRAAEIPKRRRGIHAADGQRTAGNAPPGRRKAVTRSRDWVE